MKDLIEKLKDPKQAQPFCLRSKEEQEILKKAGKQNCLWVGRDEQWHTTEGVLFAADMCYILKLDYQPEPEYVDIPIIKENGQGWLGITQQDDTDFPDYNYGFIHLHCIPSIPSFEGFWWMAVKVAFTDVARHVDEGDKVVARFRTE